MKHRPWTDPLLHLVTQTQQQRKVRPELLQLKLLKTEVNKEKNRHLLEKITSHLDQILL